MMHVEELILHAAGLPERDYETGILSICWANPWHEESNIHLTALVRDLLARGAVTLIPTEGRASSWEETFHRSVDLAEPVRRHLLITSVGLMEDMQVAVSDMHGEPLREEVSRSRQSVEESDRLLIDALANIRVLEQGLSDFVACVEKTTSTDCVRRGDVPVREESLIGELLTSVYLSKDYGARQNQIRAEVVGAYLRAMEDLRDAPYPFAQQFLNGLDAYVSPT